MLKGFIPVMITAFSQNRSIDYDAMGNLVDYYVKNGSTGLFTVCLTSEMYNLYPNERLELTSFVSKKAKAIGFEGPVLATGTFGGPVEEQADFVGQISEAGADIVVMIPSQLAAEDDDDAILGERINEIVSLTGDIKLGFYECPAPYHRFMSPELIAMCAATGRFYYLKETSGNMDQLNRKIEAVKGSSFAIFNAHQPTALPFLQTGGHGLSPIAANAAPRLFVELYNSVADPVRSAALQEATVEVAKNIRHSYPLGIKWFLQHNGFPIEPVCRTVEGDLTEEDHQAFKREADAISKCLESLGVQTLF
ncbi:MAG: dihydrodipicolinate synthase family protein [Spirochaetales bacterium]|jgi:4-hydroxy-tetrahydrodipicolinate synthase|nr:dihydrodipicolinate synthase family protein [Spirochaetales bacterium]